MRNLLLLQHKFQNLLLKDIIHIAIDINNPDLVYALTELQVYKINISNGTEVLANELDAGCNVRVGVQHLSLGNELCLVGYNGDVLILNLDTLTTEAVAFCEGGISKMSWSPDQEVVVFLTKTGKLALMDTSYNTISECMISDSEFGDGAFVNVGWGRKETQFHGTEGKVAAKEKTLIKASTFNDEEQLDRTVSIVWRGDSEYFAVSFVGADGRQFKVYDKHGKLHFTSDLSVVLEAQICWRPSGSWIAIPQRLPNKYVIALFEKNGLKHRDFTLPFDASMESILKLDWSSDSDVLAVETLNNESHKSCIYLFTMSNYHWYQKQTLLFESRIKVFFWDVRYGEGKQLHVLLEDSKYSLYRWSYDVCQSLWNNSNKDAIVMVIDGRRLLLTNFCQAAIPPPMCAYTLQAEHPINYVDFINSQENSFFILDANNLLTTYSILFENKRFKHVELLSKYALPSNLSIDMPLHFNHWLSVCNNMIIMAKTQPGATSTLCLCKLDTEKVLLLDSVIVNGIINRIGHATATEIILKADNTVFQAQFSESKWLNYPRELYNLIGNIDSLNVFVGQNNSLDLFSLQLKQGLWRNEKQIASGVTSMYRTEKYLLFTTIDKLKFIRLHDFEVVSERRIERGGRILVVVPNDSRTILQMPRGNLEIIQPRLLSLCIIGDLLNTSEYGKAFDVFRKQRINLNLLVDHNPEKFMSEIDRFVDSVSNPHLLNLFLSDLENIDVTTTMYRSNYLTESKPTTITENKINIICTAICDAIARKGKGNICLLPVLTSYVKQKKLAAALEIVWNLRKQELLEGSAPQQLIGAHEALKYLLYLVDVNQLYNVALGLYDFGLVLFVAEKSHKDPKEYLPFLNQLKNIEHLPYRHYKIDIYLKRYLSALKHIVECGEEKMHESLELIANENLYTQAMKLYSSHPSATCYKQVVHAFADNLRQKGQFQDAALMYERSGDLPQAISSARHALDWQKCITLAYRMGQSMDDIKHLITSLLPAMISNGLYLDAAELLIKCDGNFDDAIRILCDGKLYVKAMYEAGRKDEQLIETIVRPHLETNVQVIANTFHEDNMQFEKHKSRLLLIREEQRKRTLEDDTFGIPNDFDDNDAFSDTSSMKSSQFSQSSRGTGKTHRSSKNRRKHERKLLNMKEGNPYEDIALIDALYNMANASFEQQAFVRNISKSLIELRLDEAGKHLQSTFFALLQTIQNSIKDIWIPEMIVPGGNALSYDSNTDYKAVLLNEHYAMIVPHQRFPPLLKNIDWEFDVLR